MTLQHVLWFSCLSAGGICFACCQYIRNVYYPSLPCHPPLCTVAVVMNTSLSCLGYCEKNRWIRSPLFSARQSPVRRPQSCETEDLYEYSSPITVHFSFLCCCQQKIRCLTWMLFKVLSVCCCSQTMWHWALGTGGHWGVLYIVWWSFTCTR